MNIGKKTVVVSMPTNQSMYRINFKEGGNIPPELSGQYTSVLEAEKSVSFYNDTKPKVGDKAKAFLDKKKGK